MINAVLNKLYYWRYKSKVCFGCQHPSSEVTADILEGDFPVIANRTQAIQWCRTCGAYRRVFVAIVDGRTEIIGSAWIVPSKWWSR